MLRRRLEADSGLSPDAVVRLVLRCALQPFAERRGLQRTMMRWLLSEREIVDVAAAVGDRLMPLLASTLAAGQVSPDSRTHPVARQATIGAVVGAIMLLGGNDPACLQAPEVEDELVRLLLHGLRSS